MDKLSAFCACLATAGLVLVFFFSPERAFADKSAFDVLQDCSGLVKVRGTVSKFFFTSTGKPAAEVNGLSVLLKESELEAQRITIYGKASPHNNRCWVIAERVEHS